MKNSLAKSLLILFFLSLPTFGESQTDEYKGITDPFGDPSNYEFSEDEKEDKAFFHLGRFIMFGFDIGVGIFTGGLGRSNNPGAYYGGRLLYFFDKSIAFEAAVHFVSHLDKVQPNTSQFVEIDTTLLPLTGGFRYYFDTQSAPKAIAIANPYLAFGGGGYFRSQAITRVQGINFTSPDAYNVHFGFYGAAGVEFPIYRRHVYLGVDLRYHAIFFDDEDDRLGTLLDEGDRAGDYFTTVLTLTYNF